MRRVAALASGFGSKLVILREAALARADALAAFATCLSGEARVLGKAALLVRHAFTTLAGDRTLLFGVHGRETAG